MPTCRVCGRQPAAEFVLRRHVGMILMQRFVKFRGYLCRDHAIQVSKDFLTKTLVQGWWGLISFFVNFYAVYTDLAALAKAKKLGPPVGMPDVQGPQAAQPAAVWAPAPGAAGPPLPPPPPG